MKHPSKTAVQLGIYGYGPFGHLPEQDLASVLGVVRATGYDGAEIMTNVLPQGAERIRRVFSDEGLTVAGLHVFSEDLEGPGRTESLLDVMDAIGCSRLIVSSTVDREAATYLGLAQLLNETGAAGSKRGTEVYYHPHDAEYHELSGADGRRGVDVLAAETEPSLVKFNIDTYWAYRGGADPARTVREFAERCDYYHIKDGVADQNCPLEQGEVRIGDCLDAVREYAPRTDWVVYEDAHPKLPAEQLCAIARDCFVRHGFGC
ncbi:sugar phosphate isomerase/epimerase [Streptomyces anulatus]|uniref:sugar phosphate isomerase/epimerase family protein n=1 Tax=Streptomyces anulatus TaxID=1892 RepID=UPI00343FF985